MRVESIRTLAGPNVYTLRPALVMGLDLEDLACVGVMRGQTRPAGALA